MAEPLKSFFDERVVRRIAAMLHAADRGFPDTRFVADASRGLDDLELLDRARRIAGAMARALPDDYERAADVILRSLGPRLGSGEGNGMQPFLYLPHVIFVAERGLDHFDVSMRLQRELTRRFTAEFSIRAYLERHPERTLAQLRTWAADPDPHVRRLVSEGTRPRLPWAPRLRAFQKDPRPVLELLELLKDDPELYVRRSVANNLNDIGKDHPDLLVATCARWLRGAGEARRWIVKHALRWLVKRGHPGALEVLGFGEAGSIRVSGSVRPKRARIGGRVVVSVDVENRGRKTSTAAVDLAVHFVKATGAAKPKVFKGRDLVLAPRASATFEKSISLAQHTTRRHHPGRHAVEARVNGRVVPIGEFVLVR
ncbi:MAG TPA: DNA alkylation repair protein [Candidatus Polarisedimenticolaceae bacterium]